MIARALESAFSNWLTASVTGTSLAGVGIRHGIPDDALALPCVIVAAAGSALLEGGVRSGSVTSMDFSVMSAANSGAGWQTAHKNRTAALARLLDDSNTNAALASINAAQSNFTLYGWRLDELAGETAANIQTDTIRASVTAGDYTGAAPAGTANADPQDYSLRHEVEQIVSAHLATELPEAVTDDYDVSPHYSEDTVPPRRIVAMCSAAARPLPNHPRWTANVSVAVISPGEFATGHADVVELAAETLRTLVSQDLSSAKVAVYGLLESGHSINREDGRIIDTLGLTLHCIQN
jgi:hypothetical protein